MTDQSGQDPQLVPVPRPESAPAPVDRFSAPVSAHADGLTPERAAKIVRQSSSARWVAFLAVTVLAIFVAVYYFYETGIPGIDNSSRLGKEVAAQTVTDVSRGYALFQLNCARCHGAQGEGGIGPTLNDQAKLLTHLTPKYITTVLTVGGRYVCGDSNSLMPAWLEPNGPLNYRNVEELVAFLRATNDISYQGTAVDPNDPTKTVTTTQTGWRDPGYRLPAGASPVPNCWKDAFATGAGASPAASTAPLPSGSGAPGTPAPGSPAPGSPAPGSPAPSAAGGPVTLELTAAGVTYDKSTLDAPANAPFQILFTNNDAGIPHNVAIHQGSPTGAEVWKGEIFNGTATKTYEVPALAAGIYGFVCTVHANMTGTLTVK